MVTFGSSGSGSGGGGGGGGGGVAGRGVSGGDSGGGAGASTTRSISTMTWQLPHARSQSLFVTEGNSIIQKKKSTMQTDK
jgi:hypothetical protein